ncbi:MAG: sigma-70 family RNA polymerase sigma factor [Nannocystaceae bacterium]
MLVEHFFRREYGRLVATLCRRLGSQHLELVEDAVQSALLKAISVWPAKGEPKQPTGWLFRVAHNQALDELRKRSGRERIRSERQQEAEEAVSPTVDVSDPSFEGELRDDLLRMLFVCCDPVNRVESQLALALRTLCGFSVGEIALRLFASEAAVYKRLARARDNLRAAAQARSSPLDPRTFGGLASEEVAARLPAVQAVLHLLFTEGYLSSRADATLRRELCDEAIRLGTLLADHPLGEGPRSFALLALMHLHRARLGGRVDAFGGLLLLEEQERERWDRGEIELGMRWLAASAQGEAYSRYHAEAGIAAEHCLAPSSEATDWEKIVRAYELLNEVSPSPLHRLNQAVALAQWKGPAAALERLDGFVPPAWLAGSYMWSAVLADLYQRSGDEQRARHHSETALASAPTAAIQTLLERRLGR